MNHVWAQMETAMSLLENGTPEKFLDLNFAFLEAGITWIMILMFRLNKEHSSRRSELSMLTKRPEEYMRDFFYSTQPLDKANNPENIRKLLEIIDAPNALMFSSDYPHHDFDSPDELGKHLRSYTPRERENILSGNAKTAFNMDI